jgi:hypothetical protein
VSAAGSSGASSLIAGLLGCVFVTLKLCHVIDWSWWWVTLPFWGSFALIMAVVMVGLLLLGIAALFEWWAARRRFNRMMRGEQ